MRKIVCLLSLLVAATCFGDVVITNYTRTVSTKSVVDVVKTNTYSEARMPVEFFRVTYRKNEPTFEVVYSLYNNEDNQVITDIPVLPIRLTKSYFFSVVNEDERDEFLEAWSKIEQLVKKNIVAKEAPEK